MQVDVLSLNVTAPSVEYFGACQAQKLQERINIAKILEHFSVSIQLVYQLVIQFFFLFSVEMFRWTRIALVSC